MGRKPAKRHFRSDKAGRSRAANNLLAKPLRGAIAAGTRDAIPSGTRPAIVLERVVDYSASYPKSKPTSQTTSPKLARLTRGQYATRE